MSEFNVGDRILVFAPGFQAAFEGANARDALSSEEERHTGARSFVWSSAIENDFAIAGQTVVFLFELLGVHAEGAGNGFGIGFEIHGMTKIDDDHLLAGIELFLQFFDGDPGDAKFAHEAAAREELISQIGCQSANQNDGEPAAEGGGMFGDALDLAAENVTEAEESGGPEKRACDVEDQKAPKAHLEDTR